MSRGVALGRSCLAGAAVVLALVATPSTASAAPGTAAPEAFPRCTTGHVVAEEDANVYGGQNGSQVIYRAQKGEVLACHEGVWLGLRYGVCAESGDGNAWLELITPDYRVGRSPAECWAEAG